MENKEAKKIPANRKWEQKNKEKTRVDGYRRTARVFINKHSSLDDLEELQLLISERKKILKKL
jgi:putative phage-associated protein